MGKLAFFGGEGAIIKLTKHVYVHFTFFLVLALAFLFDIIQIVAFAFLTAMAHELCHLFSALLLGERPVRITVMPYGCRLSMYTIESGIHEVLIALAGPLFNLVMFLIFRTGPLAQMNLAMFIVNMLPALPLDGGRVAAVIAARLFGPFRAVGIMRNISRVLAAVIIALGALVAYLSGYNLSILIIGAFLLSSALSGDPAAMRIYKVMVGADKKLCDPGKVLGAQEFAASTSSPARLLLRHVPANKYFFVSVVDDSGHIVGRLTEEELADAITAHGARIKLGEIMKNS